MTQFSHLSFVVSADDHVSASDPLFQVLCIADSDERLALAEITSDTDCVKAQIKNIFGSGKLAIWNKVVKIIEDQWSSQMRKTLHGAGLFLNRENIRFLEIDPAYAPPNKSRLQ